MYQEDQDIYQDSIPVQPWKFQGCGTHPTGRERVVYDHIVYKQPQKTKTSQLRMGCLAVVAKDLKPSQIEQKGTQGGVIAIGGQGRTPKAPEASPWASGEAKTFAHPFCQIPDRGVSPVRAFF
jgi:hypothetical protein